MDHYLQKGRKDVVGEVVYTLLSLLGKNRKKKEKSIMSYIDYLPLLQELENTYSDELFTEKPTNLLCLSAPELYLCADIKVMIFGQETNDWESDFMGSKSLSHLIETYDSFFNNKECFSYGGQFWNGFSKIQKEICRAYEYQGKSVGFLWNNVIKIGCSGNKGKPSLPILDWQKPTYELVLQELELYNPDVIIFLSGPNYDEYIKNIFQDIKFSSISNKTERQLSKLYSKKLPSKTLRTYHPNYLWRNNFDSYLEDIITFISS